MGETRCCTTQHFVVRIPFTTKKHVRDTHGWRTAKRRLDVHKFGWEQLPTGIHVFAPVTEDFHTSYDVNPCAFLCPVNSGLSF